MKITRKFLLLGLCTVCAGVSWAPAEAFSLQNLMSSERAAPHSLKIEVNTEGSKAFISKMAGNAIGFLGNTSLTQEKKEAEFRKLLQNSFDMKTIAKFSLGRYWRAATPAQQQEYLKLFENMVVEIYSRRFNEYDGQDLEVRNVRAEGDADSIVTSYITGNGPEVQVDWRVRYKNGQYKIVDVIVEGVSMALTQRSDFSSVIQRGGGEMEVLLAHLRK